MRLELEPPELAPAPAAPAEGEALVTLHDANVSFGGVEALRGIGLTLRRGERLVLVGENGAGKTTLLRLLQGLIACPGRREHAPHGRPLRTTMLFQRPFLLRLSVRRNLLLALWLGGVAAAERPARAARALARVGLAALAERPARTLSGGQQQRLALARAWALEPDVLLLDEPTASLDPTAKREVETLIESLARDGMTLVMSTHNLGQAKRLATRVAYLERGRLLACLPTAAFFDPRQPPKAAAAFLKGELPWT
jgi:tungstate transport system ATP-binding protein